MDKLQARLAIALIEAGKATDSTIKAANEYVSQSATKHQIQHITFASALQRWKDRIGHLITGSRDTLSRLLKSGVVAGYKTGDKANSLWLVDTESLEEFFKEFTANPKPISQWCQVDSIPAGWVLLSEAMRMVGKSRNTIRRACETGAIEAGKFPTGPTNNKDAWFVCPDSLRDWIQPNTTNNNIIPISPSNARSGF